MKSFSGNSTFWEAITIFLIVLLAYGYFSSERDVNINSRLALVKAFVDEGRFEIDSYHNTELYTVDKAYINGHYYSDKAIGASVLGIFAYYPVRWIYAHEETRLTPRLFREWVTFLAISIPTALMAPLFFILTKGITNSSGRGLILTLAISLGTPLFAYGTAFYGHTLAATLFFLAFLIWFHANQQESISLQLTFVSAFLLGFMVITEYPAAVLALLLGLYILSILFKLRQLTNWKLYALFILGFLIPIGVLLFYNKSVFGSLFLGGYTHEANDTFREAQASNFMGIGWPDLLVFFYQTLHPSLGIFWLSPVLLLSPIGWMLMAKQAEFSRELFFSIASIVFYVLMFSGYYMWWGGTAYAPRHLIPILPLFILPLTFLPKKYSIPIIFLAVVSILQNMVMTACSTEGLPEYLQSLIVNRHIPKFVGMPLYQVCYKNILADHLVNNRGQQIFGMKALSSLTPLLAGEILLMAFFLFIQAKENNMQENRS